MQYRRHNGNQVNANPRLPHISTGTQNTSQLIARKYDKGAFATSKTSKSIVSRSLANLQPSYIIQQKAARGADPFPNNGDGSHCFDDLANVPMTITNQDNLNNIEVSENK